jgi:hypothetical protein
VKDRPYHTWRARPNLFLARRARMVLLLFLALFRLAGILITVLFVFQPDLPGIRNTQFSPESYISAAGVRIWTGARSTEVDGIIALPVELQFFAQACYLSAEYRARENKTVETGKLCL